MHRISFTSFLLVALVASTVIPKAWIVGWTVHVWDGIEGQFTSAPQTLEFNSKEEASLFLARCPDCSVVKKQKTEEFFCCDHKTLNELQQ